MAKLPKSIIKKYGISKRAWAVFRGQKTKRKASSGVKYMKHKRHTGKKSKGGFQKVLHILGGAAIAAAYEVFVSPMIPLSRNIKNMIEFVVGLALALMPRMPVMVRAAGAALATINAFEFIVPLISGVSGKSTGTGDLSGFLQG